MQENETIQNTEDLTPDIQVEETQTTDTETNLAKHLRKTVETKEKQLKKVTAELEAIKQAEIDKQKSQEELMVELKAKAEKLEKEREFDKKFFQIEKSLLQNNINSELSDLIVEKAKALVVEGMDESEVLETIKTKYPSVFADPKPKQIGVNVTSQNSDSVKDLSNADLGTVSLSDFAKYRQSIK